MDRQKRHGLFLAIAAVIGALLLAAALALDIASFAENGFGVTFWTVRRLPALPYLLAVIGVACAGGLVWRGRAFSQVLHALLQAIGALLFVAALLEMFGVPLLLRCYFPGSWSAYARYDPSYVAIGLLGLLLWMIGRLLRSAAGMARELDEFF